MVVTVAYARLRGVPKYVSTAVGSCEAEKNSNRTNRFPFKTARQYCRAAGSCGRRDAPRAVFGMKPLGLAISLPFFR